MTRADAAPDRRESIAFTGKLFAELLRFKSPLVKSEYAVSRAYFPCEGSAGDHTAPHTEVSYTLQLDSSSHRTCAYAYLSDHQHDIAAALYANYHSLVKNL